LHTQLPRALSQPEQPSLAQKQQALRLPERPVLQDLLLRLARRRAFRSVAP
jgi:hypothetical protein